MPLAASARQRLVDPRLPPLAVSPNQASTSGSRRSDTASMRSPSGFGGRPADGLAGDRPHGSPLRRSRAAPLGDVPGQPRRIVAASHGR